MAAFLLRRGAGSCFGCVHRELCRVLWRPQSALFSSKPTDRKQPRRTHIKKAKPQPMVDVAKLLEQLFSQRRPDAASRAAKAQAIKTSSMPTKPSATSSLKSSTQRVPPLLKTQPAVSTFAVHKNTTSTLNSAPVMSQAASPANLNTSYSQETPQQSLESPQDFANDVPPTSVAAASLQSDVSTAERLSPAETNRETATEPLSAQAVETSIETAILEPVIDITTEAPVQPSLSVVEKEVKIANPTIEVSYEEVQIKSADSGEVAVSVTSKEEPIIEMAIEPPVEASVSAVETQEVQAVVEDPANHITQALVEEVQTKSSDLGGVAVSVTTKEESLIETIIGPPVEAAEMLVIEQAVVEEVKAGVGSLEAAEAAQTTSTDSGSNELSSVEVHLIETTVTSVETISTSPLSNVETKVAEDSAEMKTETEAAEAATASSIDLGVVDSSDACKVEPVIGYGRTVEAPVEASESADIETVESSAVEEAVKDAEQMTLESVTLHDVQVQVESLQTDELLQTKSTLDEKAAEHLEQSSSSGDDCKPAAESEKLAEAEEREVLTQSLSKWDTLSEELKELEGESDMLVNELLSAAPAVVNSATVSGPPVGAIEESGHVMEEGGEAVNMTLESMTLAEVKAGVGSLETDVLLDARNALEKEAEAVATKEKVEVETAEEDMDLLEETIEAEILTLDTISEATDAIEAETSVMLEAMFGSEQGSSHPSEPVAEHQKLGLEGDQGLEAQIEAAEEGGSVLEAMTLESVTLAEVEASLGALETESLGETTGYLEKEAELLAGEKSMEVEEEVVSEGTAEALEMESLSLPEAEELSEALQTDALMEELFFSVPAHVSGVTQSQTGPETVRENVTDAGSVNVDDFPASPVREEAPLEQEVVEEEEAQTETLGTVTDLDPVQRLFLEKIREYANMRKLNEGLLEAEPDYKKYLSEETAKLQRLYGGGDLSSFPEFSFTEPEMDQDSK